MELAPRTLTGRTIRGLLWGAAALIGATVTAFTLDFVGSRGAFVLVASVGVGAALAFGFRAVASAPSLLFALAGVLVLPAMRMHAHADAPLSAGAWTLAVLLGAMAASVLVRPVAQAAVATAAEGALDRFEVLAVAAGRSLFVCALCGLFATGPIARTLSVLAVLAALGTFVVARVRDHARAKFLQRVYAGDDPSFCVERDVDVRGYELLPPVLSGTLTNAVIAHVDAGPATYRHSDAPRPLARCEASLPRMLSRLQRRVRNVATLAVAFSGTSALLMLGHPLARAQRVPPTPVAIASCVDARPYFRDRLEAEEGIGRAMLLTHAQDPTLGEHDGLVIIVPRSGLPATATQKTQALTTARSIPCKDKLDIKVEEATYRYFVIDATLTLDPGVDAKATLRYADEQVRELFQADDRPVYNPHFGFGETEKSFGYRLRHVLRHVGGVHSVKATVDGSEGDIPLGPRDFPRLRGLTLSVKGGN